jgi:nitroreductase
VPNFAAWEWPWVRAKILNSAPERTVQPARFYALAEYLAAHIHGAPVWIVPCLESGTSTRTSGSSIYPAVQNLLLAARALGLGTTLTTLYLQFEKEAEPRSGCRPAPIRMPCCRSAI